MDRLLKFDYLTSVSIRKVIQDIDRYNREWKIQDQLDVEQLRELRHLATVQSIGSSTRIEGATLEDAEVAALISELDITQLKSRDEEEVVGYFNVLGIIQEQYVDLEISENLIKGLHNELMRHNSKDQHHRGDYKQQSNQVVATNAKGEQKVIFNTTSVLLTGEAMRSAVDWLNQELASGQKHPLMVIGTFIYEFLSIHPFQDGNGRLSRLLTTLLLLQAGYGFVEYASLERIIEADKAAYYKALMLGQRHRGQKEEEIGRWIYFLLSAIRELTNRLGKDDGSVLLQEPPDLYLNQRQQKVLNFLLDESPLSVKEIDSLLPLVSRNTLKYDLRKLTEAGLLTRKGKGRGTVYVSK